jgi:putative transposase
MCSDEGAPLVSAFSGLVWRGSCADRGMQTQSPGHLKTFEYRGLHRYSLTFCTDYRKRLFVDATTVTLVLDQVLRAANETAFAVMAYCFMPDHVHLVIEGTRDDSDCLRFIKMSKQYSGFAFSKSRGEKLWQRYGFEHVLRDDELTLVVARYVLQNPVRAGLVTNRRDYPFIGSQVYTLKELLEAVADVRST